MNLEPIPVHKVGKKPYAKPVLQHFGAVVSFTGSTPGSGPDNMMGLTSGPVKPMM